MMMKLPPCRTQLNLTPTPQVTGEQMSTPGEACGTCSCATPTVLSTCPVQTQTQTVRPALQFHGFYR